MPNADRLARAGEKFLSEGRPDEAAKAFRDALLENSDHLPSQLGLARLSMGLGLSKEAGLLLDQLLERNPNNTEGLVLRALIAEGRNELSFALELYSKAATTSPSEAYTRYQFGRALCVARRFPEAILELQAAAQLEPKAVVVQYALGVAFKESARSGEAIAAFTRTIEIDPRFADGYLTLADVLCELRQEDLARKVLQQGRILLPEDGDLCDKLAAVQLKLGDSRGAVDSLKARVVREPTEEALVSLATVSLGAGDATTAAGAVDKLLASFPKSWRGHHLKSMLLDAADELEPAIAELREAHRLAPGEWRPLNDLGTLLNARSREEPKRGNEAVKTLEQAAALAPPKELAPRYNLALAYWNAGSPAQARETIDDLLKGAPADHPVAAQARQFLEAVTRAGG